MAKIKSLQKIDLPREKLTRYGTSKLADHELLAIILGSGIRGKNILEISKSIIKTITIQGVNHTNIENISKIHGVGKVKAMQVLACIALGQRLNNPNKEIFSDKDIWNLCSDIKDSKKEHFLAFYLDTHDRLIERQIISIGTLDASLVHPREVFEPAIKLSASSIILAHNHPSGSLDPSESDLQVTQKLIKSGEIIGIPIQKHIIITNNGCKQLGISA